MYSLSKEESDRIKIVKLIAIIFVVYIHSYATEVHFSDGTDLLFLPIWLQMFEDGISQVVSRCGVPIFFLISSILFFKTNRTYIDTIKKKTKTLLFPYLIWNTFWIVVFIFLQSISFTSTYFSGNNIPILQRSLIEWLELYGIGKGFPSPQCYPLWFMRDLMAILLVFPVIKLFINKCPKIMLIVGIWLVFTPVGIPFRTALAWFIIGAFIVKMKIHITVFDKIPIKAVAFVYLTGFVISLLLEISLVRNIFVFIGIVFWIRMSKKIYDNQFIRKVFLWLSDWTFMIYVFHELTLSSVKKICLRLLPTTPTMLFLEYMFIPILIMTGCVTIGIIFKKIAPNLYRFSTGER